MSKPKVVIIGIIQPFQGVSCAGDLFISFRRKKHPSAFFVQITIYHIYESLNIYLNLKGKYTYYWRYQFSLVAMMGGQIFKSSPIPSPLKILVTGHPVPYGNPLDSQAPLRCFPQPHRANDLTINGGQPMGPFCKMGPQDRYKWRHKWPHKWPYTWVTGAEKNPRSGVLGPHGPTYKGPSCGNDHISSPFRGTFRSILFQKFPFAGDYSM